MSNCSSTRSEVKYTWFLICPRLSMQREITGPTYSAAVMMDAFTKGSSICLNRVGSGISDGALITWYSSLVMRALNCTEGTVVMTVMSNSRSNRSCTISICSIPKNPQRKPKPKAAEVSGSQTREASLSCNFSMDARNSSNSVVSTG